MKAVFKVKWKDGTPQLPELSEGMEIDGISANESITGNGVIEAEIQADESVIEELKEYLEFVECVIEE